MAEKFGKLKLQRGVISNGHRAYALTGVTAALSATDAPNVSTGILTKLRGRSHHSASHVALKIDGPGFVWLVQVNHKNEPAANDFAAKINEEARRINHLRSLDA